MFDLNGWWMDNNKFRCQNVIVWRLNGWWYIVIDGETLTGHFSCAEDALKEAERFINWDV